MDFLARSWEATCLLSKEDSSGGSQAEGPRQGTGAICSCATFSGVSDISGRAIAIGAWAAPSPESHRAAWVEGAAGLIRARWGAGEWFGQRSVCLLQ
jgi:hypothetical protein